MQGISIRGLTTWEEMGDVEDIQRSIWSESPADIVYAPMLTSIARNGGLVLGAFAEDRLVGFALAFLGMDTNQPDRPAMANLKLCSKRLGILAAYRNHNIGYQLKLAQRDFAQKRSIRLITWTYDPLLSRNAYFNLRKLGCLVSRYHRDYYGTESPSLTILGSSDRLQADWWITSRRVAERLEGSRGVLTLAQYLGAETSILNPTTVTSEGFPVPAEQIKQPDGLFALVEIPTDYLRLAQTNLALARSWRTHSREVFGAVLNRGYVATDFIHENYAGRSRSFYLFGLDDNTGNSGAFSPN